MSIQSRAAELTPAGSDLMTDSWRGDGAHTPPDTPIVSANRKGAAVSVESDAPLTTATKGPEEHVLGEILCPLYCR